MRYSALYVELAYLRQRELGALNAVFGYVPYIEGAIIFYYKTKTIQK